MAKGLEIVHYNVKAKTWIVTVNGYYTLPAQSIHPFSPENKVCAAIIAREQMIDGDRPVTAEATEYALTRGRSGSL